MKKMFLLAIATFLVGLVSSSLTSCSKKNDNPPSGSTVVKYELTGNYTGRIFVAFTDQNGGTANETVSLPWSKELTVQNSIIAVGFGGQTSAPNYGAGGQTITAKLYIGNQLKQSGTSTADVNGAVTLPNLASPVN